MTQNFRDNAKVYEIGEYINGVRIGTWNYVFENKIIDGGVYKENGIKNGIWIELSDSFSSSSQITYNGEYQDGKKFGLWTTMYRGKGNEEFTKIGGGQYNENQKNGDWIELSDYFSNLSQVIYQGHYLFGKKSGQWDTMARLAEGTKFAQIGGGIFDKNGMKQGKWVDLCNCFQSYVQITYHGQYQDDLKVGKWDTMFKEYSGDKYSQIGGGSFEQRGMKIGNWIELSDGFYRECQIIYQGEYQNGLKVGKWDIMYRKNIKDDYQKIGGGLFDHRGMKDNIWEDLQNCLSRKISVLNKGQYKNNKKYGIWEIQFEGEKVGGGLFDENGMKDGKWIELSDICRSRENKILYQGEYQKGKKIGKWDIQEIWETYYDHEYFTGEINIGGGLYDDTGLKEETKFIYLKINQILFCKWLELSNDYSLPQRMFTGEYKRGKKMGIWNTMLRKPSTKPIEFIGGGSFDETGRKDGKWVELGVEYSNSVIQKGEYKNGQKIGIWETLESKGFGDSDFKKISEKNYVDTF